LNLFEGLRPSQREFLLAKILQVLGPSAPILFEGYSSLQDNRPTYIGAIGATG